MSMPLKGAFSVCIARRRQAPGGPLNSVRLREAGAGPLGADADQPALGQRSPRALPSATRRQLDDPPHEQSRSVSLHAPLKGPAAAVIPALCALKKDTI